ncbi:hypothetical protein EMIT0196MI5_260034 [Pseudomonas sp. IT-196MI5]
MLDRVYTAEEEWGLLQWRPCDSFPHPCAGGYSFACIPHGGIKFALFMNREDSNYE